MEGLLGLAVIFILCWIFKALGKKASAKKKRPPVDGGPKKPNPPVDEGPKKPNPPMKEAVQVYFHEPEIRGWCCPNCECENNYSRTNCCVCNYQRK